MKRLVTLLLAAGIMLGGATMGTANAVGLKAGGQWQFQWGWADGTLADPNTSDRFIAQQRIRPEFRFVADENLSATLQFEIGNGAWGAGAWGMGADATAVKVRYGYVDWVVPGVDLKVRMGAQNMKLPQYSTTALVFGGSNDITGIALSYAPIDELDLSLFWARPVNLTYDGLNADGDRLGTSGLHDTVDVFALAGTWKGDGFKVTPYVVVAQVGTNAMLRNSLGNGSNVSHLAEGLLPVTAGQSRDLRRDSDMAWWLGIGGELTMFDPFKVGLDFAYGSADFGQSLYTTADANGVNDFYDLKRRGWMVSALASYKLDMVTPGLALWYASGDDSNPMDGSERMPYIYQDVNNLSTYFFDSGFENSKFSQTLVGTWGAQLRFDNISFVENLKHSLRVGYMKGTNDKVNVAINGVAGSGYVANRHVNNYLTEEDSAWFLNFDTAYQVYKNLTAELNLGYMKFSWDEAVWGRDANGKERDDKMYLATITMTYKF